KAKLTDPSGYIVKPFDDSQLRVAIELAPVRHDMERKARRVARLLNATLTSIGDAVIATNTHAEILLINPAAEKLTGWTQNEAIGKPFDHIVRLVHLITRQPVENPALRALHDGLVVRLDPDTVLIQRNGEERFVDDSASPISDEAGNILGAVVVLVDSTDRTSAESRVQTLTRQVAALLVEQEKQEMHGAELEAFAAAVSHDLRGPLVAITGFSQLLSTKHRDRLDASGQRFLDRVHTNALQMTRMMEDYLRFLGLTGQQPLRLAQVDLKGLVLAIFDDLISLPGQKPTRLVCESLPQVWADESILQHALVNLLSNALKYSSRQEQPVVEVGAIAGSGTGESLHTCFVRDNGTGMDLAHAEKLFEPFHRFHNVADFPGTGVGLAIVKRIVERHGGRIWAESQPGAGATFFFTLPTKAPSEQKLAYHG
ncbi:MAG: ATP-binding protein, partial [Pseudomonadota bacterium]